MYYLPSYYPIWCQKSPAGVDQVTPMVSENAAEDLPGDTK